MTKERLTELRALAAKSPGQKSSAILELCNALEESQKTVIHLRLKSKPPKTKPGIGFQYGVG